MVPRLSEHEELQALVAVYALDALEDDEVAVVEDHLRDCPQCRSDLVSFRESAALLAHAGSSAPEGLWDRIARSLESPPPPLQLVPAVERPRRSLSVRVMAVVGAVAAAVAGFLGLTVARQSSRIDRMAADLRVSGLQRAASEAAVNPSARVAQLKASDGQVGADAVVLPDGMGYLIKPKLPALAPGRTYQLWAIVGSNRISAGVLGPNPQVTAFRVPPEVAGFAVTDEVAGGVAASDNLPVVLGTVSRS